MKKLFVAVGIAAVCFSVQAQVKCESDGKGGMCCWDIKQFGPFRPISC
jgi:hypothetical protein